MRFIIAALALMAMFSTASDTTAATTTAAVTAQTTVPANAQTTPETAGNQGTTLPVSGETTLPAGETTAVPADGDTTAPVDGETTAEPADGDTTAAPADGDTTAAPADGDTTAAPADGDTTAAPADGDTTAPAADGETTAAAADGETTLPATDNLIVPSNKKTAEVELDSDFSAITDLAAWLADCTAALSSPTMKCESARAGSVIVTISSDNQADDVDSEVLSIQTNGITIAGTPMTVVATAPITVPAAPLKPCFIAFEDLDGFMGGPCMPIEVENPMMAQMLMNGGVGGSGFNPATAALMAGGDMEFDMEDGAGAMAAMAMAGRGGNMNPAMMAMMGEDGFDAFDNLQAKHEKETVLAVQDESSGSFYFMLLICSVLFTAGFSFWLANYMNKKRHLSHTSLDIPLTEEDIMV